MAAADTFRDCLVGGGTIEDCAAAALEAMNACIANCGEPPSCEDICNARASDVFSHCISEPGSTVEQCAAAAAAARNECLANCPPP
jgi:hypothetical protein